MYWIENLFDIYKKSVYNKYRKWQFHKRGFARYIEKTHIYLAKYRCEFLVCPAWATTCGWKSHAVPDSGELLANDKCVHREVEYERSQ